MTILFLLLIKTLFNKLGKKRKNFYRTRITLKCSSLPETISESDKDEDEEISKRTPGEKCKITIYDLIVARECLKIFPGIQFGTIESKAKNLTELIFLLNPFFLINDEIQKLKKNERKKYFFKKFNRIFTMPITIEERLSKYKKAAENDYEKTEKIIISFFKENQDFINSDKFNKYHRWNNIGKTIDLIQGRYLVDYNRKVYSFDTTQLAKNFKLTIVIDNSSRIIIKRLISFNDPKAESLIQMFQELLTPEFKKRCKIIHCDRTGASFSDELREYFNKENIAISYTVQRFRNQIVEGAHQILKRTLETYKLENFPDSIKFNDLNKEDKILMTDLAIERYNNSITLKTSDALHGKPRIFVDSAKEFVRNARPEIADENLKIEKTKTIKGNFLSKWIKLILITYSIAKLQTKLSENEDFNFPLINKNILIELQDICLEENKEKLEILEKTLKTREKIIKIILKQISYFKNVTVIPNEMIEEQIQELIKEKYKNAKKEDDLFDSSFQLRLFKRTRNLKEKNKEECKEIKELIKISEIKENELKKKDTPTLKLEKKINLNVKKIKNTKKLKDVINESIFAEDFETIMKQVNFGKTDFEKAKYKLAHILLKITGGTLSALRYFNFKQLSNLFNKKTIYIIVTMKQPRELIAIPYVKEIEKYLKWGEKEYLYIKQCKRENNNKLYKGYRYSDAVLRSEIWGDINYSVLDDQLNKQLKEASTYLITKKRLTTKSYRKGIALLSILIVGMNKTEALLGFKQIESVEKFMERTKSDKSDIEKTLKLIHEIENNKAKILEITTKYKEEETMELIKNVNKIVGNKGYN